MALERLQKIIAQAGVCSRRAAEKYILDGRVRVNGNVVKELGAKADPQRDSVEIDGHGALKAEAPVYIAMYKPEKVVSTVSDPERRQTVIDVLRLSRATGQRHFEGDLPRVYPVGRLDFNAEGLLLLTNDGALSQALLHPRHHVPKTYVVKVSGRPDARSLERLRNGVRLRNEDGSSTYPTAPAEVRAIKENPSNTWLELTIIEGRNHQVKRMCDAIGHSTIRLIRTVFGGIELGDLPGGAWRFLTEAEVERLKSWNAGMGDEKTPAKRKKKPRPEGRRTEAAPRGERKPRPEGRRAEFAARGEQKPRSEGRRAEFAPRGEQKPRPEGRRSEFGGARGERTARPEGRRSEFGGARGERTARPEGRRSEFGGARGERTARPEGRRSGFGGSRGERTSRPEGRRPAVESRGKPKPRS